ncbi:bifunctional 2-polyprenyl-6-hydroxyphenol methylase/3-demethylubiquinol 3-O-methyltransferase UbiG [Pontibacter sp. HSC-36F09]|uniref:class I SAM-dependent methyltransferase n=1 Tax=Pontibacter sp. HSC-36F09 TaxID=2910966 RepID=UPI00209F162A|nr:class I SAM-dependent methyltransferase [Pontibacter sp. HSC-36F09]
MTTRAIKQMKHFLSEKNSKNPIFIERFPDIKYEGMRVIDLGCGYGALTVDMAQRGASQVVGVDIEPNRIEDAREIVQSEYPEIADRISFVCCNLKDLPDEGFDLIISKASFEHILSLDVLLADMRDKLKIGGKIVTGFGPLYNSPWGDHRRLQHKLPWTHIIFGEQYYLDKINKNRQEKVQNIYELGLNGYSLQEYINMFNSVEGMVVTDFRTNVSDKLSMKMFKVFSNFPFMREYFTYNIYCVLERVR